MYYIRRCDLDRAMGFAETAAGFYELALFALDFGDYELAGIYTLFGDILLDTALRTAFNGIVYVPVRVSLFIIF